MKVKSMNLCLSALGITRGALIAFELVRLRVEA